MGCRRGGWYGYDGLDNGGVPSATRIVPELQRVGDVFPWTPTTDDGFLVRALEPERSLVLGGDAGSRHRVTWAFVLETSTRLITRASGAPRRRPHARSRWRPIDFGMQRRQLLNIRRRVEAGAR